MKKTSRRLLLIVVILSVTTLGACTTKITYNYFLEWGLQWKISRLVNLDSEQKKQVKQHIKAFHDWHRATQLPRYVAYIDQFIIRLDNDKPFTKTEIHAITDDIQLFLDDCLNYVMPDIQTVLVSLNDAQVDFLLSRIDEERAEYKEEYIDISEKKRIKTRIKELTKYTKRVFGKFDDKQKSWVDAWASSLTPYEQLNAKQQRIWQQDIASLLAKRHSATDIRPELENLMFYRTDNWQPELQQAMDENQDLTYDLFAKLVNNLNEAQLAHFKARLQSYRDDFQDLARTE